MCTVFIQSYINHDYQIEQQEKKSNRIVYLTDGEGREGGGDGSIDNPYTNIRTALKNIQDGETLMLIGRVMYTKYEYHVDNSALPLLINKNITIEGIDKEASLYSASTTATDREYTRSTGTTATDREYTKSTSATTTRG